MKRVLAISFLFVFLIAYITPITSVKATEVVWGDNNNYYLTDEEFYTSRQLATLEIIPQLTGNGVNELSINNASSIDDWIINFLEFVDENAQSTVSDIYNTCVEIKNEIDNTANRIGQELKSFGTDLNNGFGEIADWFDNLTGVKTTYLTNPSFVRDFSRLSRIQSPNPSPEPDIQYAVYINRINSHNPYSFYWDNAPTSSFYGGRITGIDRYCTPMKSYDLESWFSFNTNGYIGEQFNYSNNGWSTTSYSCTTGNIKTLQINSIGNDQYTGIISDITIVPYCQDQYGEQWYAGRIQYNNGNYSSQSIYWSSNGGLTSKNLSYTGTLSQVFNYFQDRVKNVNIYVDDIPWAIVDDSIPVNISLDINGIDMYSNNNQQPIQYYFPQGTQIDYKKLYLVIKQAIEDSLPISQTTINQGDVYYDNSNNVYSPIIYNYYNDDDESEDDLISDILTLAVIPKFDTALLEPIEEPITNGTVIMITGVQALPSDILFVIGAGFVLILFGAFINRLIE